jgi:hypothetical protein
MISPKKAVWFLISVVLLIILTSITASYLQFVSVDGDFSIKLKNLFVESFRVDGEGNIPTWFSSSMLLLCAILLLVITIAKKNDGDQYAIHWGVLSLIFLGMSLDEAAVLHERTINTLREAFNLGGFLYYSWIILGIAFLLLFALVYLRFFINLPRKSRSLFLFAGILYVGGAIMMEAIGGRYHEMHGNDNMTYELIATVEESLEMFGVVFFIYALLQYITTQLELGKLISPENQAKWER